MDNVDPTKPSLLSPNSQTPTELYRKPSVERDGKTGKRGRASKPKVKSGCITCKTRRVKCDETKPQCIRCQKFGRVCDGYLPEQPPARGFSNIRPRTPSAGLYNPSVSAHDTEDESRYFRVFSERTVFALSGLFEGTPSSHFWTQLVLQESHNLKAIRHAVMALGALTKSLENAPQPSLKVNIIQSLDQKHREQAVLQHLKAIQALNLYISSSTAPQLRNALLTCLLIICFEVFQGGFLSTVQQTESGISMLRSYYSGQGGSRTLLPRYNSPDARGETSKAGPSLQPQLDSMTLANPSMLLYGREFLEPANMQRLEIGVQAPSPEHSMYGETSYSDFSTDIETTRIFSTQNYLNALPSNTTTAHWQAGSHLSSANRATEPMRSRSASIASSSVTGSGPPSRSGSINQSSVPTPNPQRPLSTFSGAPSPSLLQSDMKIEDVLIQAFIRLDSQCLTCGIPPSKPPIQWDIKKIHHIAIPNVFSNFYMAHRCWDFLFDRIVRFRHQTLYSRLYAPETSDSPTNIATEVEFYRNQLMAFHNAFRPILDESIQNDGTIINPAAILVSLYQRYTAILLSVILEGSEMVYDNHLSDFQYIVNTCRLLAESIVSTQLPRMPRFSLDTGIVLPLSLVANRCRDRTLRREAIDLLFANPRQEGMWDSILVARVGSWISSWEEEGLPVLLDTSSHSDMSGLSSNLHSNYAHSMHENSQSWNFNSHTPELVDSMTDRMTMMGVDPFATTNTGGLFDDMMYAPDNMHTQRHPTGRGLIPGAGDGFSVPEENRVQLSHMEFHINDRYALMRARKVISSADGTHEERETILRW
ncbi:Zn2/Cys6 DNA-binding protein [Glarea lozoyensis ATCC 20868]|uniref:Zn2/Cys6 DNA-binding protein n=1 Tax=Glarea lozoyensis (strain ATCC 20868 / MF5171) TaxID=1116229 RepID=S3E1J3_GLAL2|nr:Zn2/Cys6 DNA-binding protein [Glarea lozoyensis ATCC 20868]EPE32343.1 Zn2/Cys6 DNA-binding protein [Glarea lozoyensis ATCC 20868]